MPPDVDRDPGIVNTRMRKYLVAHPDSEITRGEKTQPERNLRAAIRSRVSNGIQDFSLLQNLRDDDREAIYEDGEGWQEALTFLFRPYISDIIEKSSTLEASGSQEYDSKEVTSLFESFFGYILENAIERALAIEAPELEDEEWFQTDVNVDIDVSVTKTERLNVVDVDQQLRSGDMTFQEVREHFADGKLTIQEVQQLTRGEEIRGDPSDPRREEILSDPLPMLRGDLPDGYMKIRLTNPHMTTTKLHDEQYMPPGYNVRFSDDRTAIVLREVGTNLIEAHEHIEAVGGTHTDPSGE